MGTNFAQQYSCITDTYLHLDFRAGKVAMITTDGNNHPEGFQSRCARAFASARSLIESWARSRLLRQFWLPIAFGCTALLLAFDPLPFVSPVAARTPAPAWAIDTTPVRQPKPKPEYTAAGYIYQCMDCHRIIPSPSETLRKLAQHTEITLQHGLNARCFNCHHPVNRNAFVDDFGQEIAWNEPQLVCAKCHGPVYRDWQAGSHGRINGYWDKDKGPQTKCRCVECHDPHSPPFQGLQPAPGPNTLRMGKPAPAQHQEIHDPLRIFTSGANGESKS